MRVLAPEPACKHPSASLADHRSSTRRFQKGGPSAVSNFDAGVSGFEARAFRGLGVFTSTPVRRFACRAARLRLSLSVALQD